jgi:hypothetical protein
MPDAVWWKLPVLWTLGCGLLWWLCGRAAGSLQLRGVLILSFSVRLVLALALYVISYFNLPVLSSLQLGHGFWLFGPDSQGYDVIAGRIAHAWAHQIELFDPGTSIEYFLVVAAVYWLLGRHALYAMALNAWLAAINGLLAYLIGKRLFDDRAARRAGVLVALWPSSLLWSAQILKDSLAWTLILGALWLAMRAMPVQPTSAQPRLSAWLWRCGLLAGLVVLLTRLRFYLGSILSVASGLVLAVAVASALARRQFDRALRCAGLLVVVVGCMLTARTIKPFELVSPAHPELGRFRLGLEDYQQGHLDPAALNFVRAIQFDDRLTTAYGGLAAVMLRQGAVHEALAVLSVYLEKEPDAARRQQVGELLVEIATAAPEWLRRAERYKRWDVPEETIAQLEPLFLPGSARQITTVRMRESPEPLPSPGELSPQWQAKFQSVVQGFSRVDEEVQAATDEMKPSQLGRMREGFVDTGGHSLMDAWAKISSPRKLLTYLPRALTIGLLAPFPWQWFDTRGSTGIMRVAAGAEMVLLYLLVPAMVLGSWSLIQQRRPDGFLMLVFILLTAVSLSLVVANLGTLFRLRLQFLLPLLVVAAGGQPVQALRRLWTALRRVALQPTARLGQRPC